MPSLGTMTGMPGHRDRHHTSRLISCIALSCSPGLCVVTGAGDINTPNRIHWDVDVTGATPSFPHICEDRTSCSFICRGNGHGYNYPTVVTVTVRDSDDLIIGSASTFTGCSSFIW